MANFMYNSYGQRRNDGGLSDLITQVKEVQRTFRGDPRAEVQRLLNSGEMSQQQFNQLSQIANQVLSAMRG